MIKEGPYWDSIVRHWPIRNFRNRIYAEHKKNIYLKLMARWLDAKPSHLILKTDLFAEAIDVEQFLFDTQWAHCTLGMDVSIGVVSKAKEAAGRRGLDSSNYTCCDVRALPFKDNCFDYVISDSTLDHFPSESQIITALEEISRVLKVGGALLLTIDNKSNLTYPPYLFIRLWMKLGLAPYFIGKTLSLDQSKSIIESLGLALEDSTAIFHCPHPDGLIRGLESITHIIFGDKLNGVMRGIFSGLESLENTKVKLMTGRYLALKAIKRK